MVDTPQKKGWEHIPKGSHIIRFTDANWACFFTKGKKTTWRTTKRKDGTYLRVKGSLYNPKPTGEKLELKYTHSKPFEEINEQEAIDDGFDSLELFRAELMKLNKHKLAAGKQIGVLHCHSAKVIELQCQTTTV